MNFLSNPKNALLSIFATALLGGCTTPVTPDFAEMSKKYATLLEQYQINNLFMNIIRSYEGHPLSFMDMPNVIGSGSVSNSPSISASQGALSVGGALAGLTSINPSWGLSFGNSFNFTQSSLDNSIFWKSFMEPIPPESINYFRHNHIPQELLMTLVVDQIIITQPNGSRRVLINNPLRPDYSEFQKVMYQLIDDGFRTEYVVSTIDEGAPLSESELKRQYGKNPVEHLAQSNRLIKPVAEKTKNSFQVSRQVPSYKHCMDIDRYANFVQEGKDAQIYCADFNNQNSAASIEVSNKPKLKIVTRSVKNIYDFLGQTMKAQLKDKPYLITLPPSAQTIADKADESNGYALFVVLKNPSGIKTHSVIDALDGNTYAVPFSNNGYSPLVMNILSQFQTLAKSPAAIPSSPAVLIK